MTTVVFAGFGKLGYRCISTIHKLNIKILFVLTHKDLSSESVDRFCQENKINFSYSDLRKDKNLQLDLYQTSAKYLISINYRYILPRQYLEKFEYPLNIHGSLLPKYRGRTPHVWAIINGENKTGITCHLMEESVDTGPIIHQIEIVIGAYDTGADLLSKFEKLYPDCLLVSIEKLENGFLPIIQNDFAATYFGKRIPEMGCLDFSKSAKSLVDFIRALAKPYPGAFCYLGNGTRITVNKAEIIQAPNVELVDTGMIIESDGCYIVRVSDGFLRFIDFEINGN